MKDFDRRFGAEFIAKIPTVPGVYRIFNPAGELIYIGKAKNLRRRLGQYRNAKRARRHRKMRAVLKDAQLIQWEVCPSELEALLLETRLIQEHRPKWNVAGAFYFLYPQVGLRFEGGVFSIGFSTSPETLEGFALHGAYRSRWITGEAFFAWARLLRYIGHPEKRKKDSPKRTYLFRFRRIPQEWLPLWERFFRGEGTEALEQLILALVENAAARKRGPEIQEQINSLRRFFRHEARLLGRARRALGYGEYPVPQKERDLLLLKYRQVALDKKSSAPPLVKSCPP